MKIPRGVYYLSLGQIVRSLLLLPTALLRSSKLVERFESRLKNELDLEDIVLMPHARISFYTILKAQNFEKRSEVIMSPTNIPDMVNMVLLLGLRPVFVDFDKNSHFSSASEAKSLITEKTKAIFLTHLNGVVGNLNDFKNLAKEKNILLIQDCTQSYSCRYQGANISEFADFSFYSMCSLKDIHTHIGSFITSPKGRDLSFVRKVAKFESSKLKKRHLFKYIKEDLIASIGLNPYIFSYFTYYLFYPIMRYDKKIIEDLIDAKGIQIGPFRLFKGLFGGVGYERRQFIPREMLYRFTNFQARVGLNMMVKYRDRLKKRVDNTNFILSNLCDEAQKRVTKIDKCAENSFWRLPIIVDNPSELEEHLFFNGIDPGKTTLPCLPQLKIFEDWKRETPNADYVGRNTIYLPNFHYLGEKELRKVVEVVNQYFKER